MKLERLYHFSDGTHQLIEVKRLDGEAGAPLSDTLKWLLLTKTSVIQEFTFKGMSQGEVEKREFEEGHLEFDDTQAKLILPSRTYTLKKVTAVEWPRKLIEQYLAD